MDVNWNVFENCCVIINFVMDGGDVSLVMYLGLGVGGGSDCVGVGGNCDFGYCVVDLW